MKKSTLNTIIVAVVAALILLTLFKKCDGCKSTETTTTISDTTTTTIPGKVEHETPNPVIAVPEVDSSIYRQLENYKRLFMAERNKAEKAKQYFEAVQKSLLDTALNLESRYGILKHAFDVQERLYTVASGQIEYLQKKIVEAASGDYLTESVDSTADYKLTWSIRGYAPLRENGFVRKVDVYQKTITNETTVTKNVYPKFSLSALYGVQPDNTRIYALQLGKDFGRIGLVSQDFEVKWIGCLFMLDEFQFHQKHHQ